MYQPPFMFLGLPLEIRLIVYRLFAEWQQISIRKHLHNRSSRRTPRANPLAKAFSILLVSKQCKAEAEAILWNNLTFRFVRGALQSYRECGDNVYTPSIMSRLSLLRNVSFPGYILPEDLPLKKMPKLRRLCFESTRADS